MKMIIIALMGFAGLANAGGYERAVRNDAVCQRWGDVAKLVYDDKGILSLGEVLGVVKPRAGYEAYNEALHKVLTYAYQIAPDRIGAYQYGWAVCMDRQPQ